MYKKPSHRRDNSGELDVFEAAKYFSGQNESNNNASFSSVATFAEKAYRDDNKQAWRIGRTSLDMSVRSSIPIPTHHHHNSQILHEKKYKQPSSPGGKLASFLNSLFNQTSSKKKKSKSTQSVKDEEESPGGWRRRRRSSISHFRSSNAATADSKSIIYSSSSNSGFRAPPTYPYTPTKSYKDLRSSSDHKEIPPFSKSINVHVKVKELKNEALLSDNRITDHDMVWLNEKVMKFSHGVSEKEIFGNDKIWEDQEEKIEYKNFSKVDEGAESDSSSDLFELQNYDLCYYSSSLPVYETTNMGSIKRGTPISNGPI